MPSRAHGECSVRDRHKERSVILSVMPADGMHSALPFASNGDVGTSCLEKQL